MSNNFNCKSKNINVIYIYATILILFYKINSILLFHNSKCIVSKLSLHSIKKKENKYSYNKYVRNYYTHYYWEHSTLHICVILYIISSRYCISTYNTSFVSYWAVAGFNMSRIYFENANGMLI